ncbi:hypothetical protein BEWA_036310 [Theileria equi strain WA]|uniref:Uncharacterized protein n=1 Tax=Theileria equi strain WA TaxID=1537102 RepID=L1LEB3_THEEQ|nr:hypothetical protein BEWA_036310 [Theileria equi strain WA]EKX73595.1 hypothetical protein BEWA_036310 [Theileria equi strain WA]|eukprot:XP_004833047.1 hypothetical protein BEWA_036310 [Theileria equi strain WA]
MVTKSDGTDACDTNGETGSENCRHDGAHIIDVSEKGSYQCPGGCGNNITVADNCATSEYSYSHLVGSFFRFKDGVTEQAGINFLQSTTRVYVYYYPSGYNRIPLLIYLLELSDKWYQRTSIDSVEWNEVEGTKPGGPTNSSEIIQLLKDILPTVTVNVGYKTGLETSESSTSYEDNSEGGEEGKQRINVKRKNIEAHGEGPKYVGFTHSVQDKTYFVVKDVQYNTSTLPGIPLTFILTSVTAYYSDGPKFTLKNLLLVGFEKRGTDQNNYVYYGRKDGGSNWTPLHDQTGKLDDTEFIKSLLNKGGT